MKSMVFDKSLLEYIDERMKVLNTMRAFADRESKVAFDNMIHELAQVRIQVERIVKRIEQDIQDQKRVVKGNDDVLFNYGCETRCAGHEGVLELLKGKLSQSK